MQQQGAQKLATAALDSLGAGKPEQAQVELQCALGIEPNHALATSLLRQISADPIAVLGKESFSYRLSAGDTLSTVARRFLGDVYLFYILARYNDIKVPRQVGAGQVVRVPGKQRPGSDPPAARPTAAATPAPAASPAPPSVPAPVTPPTPAQSTAAPSPAPPPAPVVDEASRTRLLVAQHTQSARRASARQDLIGAIAAWDKVLELEPENQTARLERQRAIDLKRKLDSMK